MVKYNPEKMRLETVETSIPLTRKESELYTYLLERKGKVCAYDDILLAVWTENTESNVLTVYVKYLRQKLNKMGVPGDHHIQTVRGDGYKLVELGR